MSKNITLRLDEAILRKARHLAVEQNRSLSQWVADLIAQVASEKTEFAAAKRRALKNLAAPLHLGGKPLSRDEIYER